MSSFQVSNLNRRVISKLLITVVLFSALIPAHYHLHHLYTDGSSAHAHVIDLHLVADSSHQQDHDADTSIFAATPDGVAKTDNSKLTTFILLTICLLLLPVLNKNIGIICGYFDLRPRQHHLHFSPPLRAPPLH
jgi:hypothetical protein